MIGYTYFMITYFLAVVACFVVISKDKKLPLNNKTWGIEAFMLMLSLFAFYSLSGIAVNWMLGVIFALYVSSIVRGVTRKLSEEELTAKDAGRSALFAIGMMVLLTLFVVIYG